MKTGFTCAAGFNVVASATHGGRRLIAVVLGSPSARERTAEAAALFDRAFANGAAALGSIESLPSPGVGAAPDMHQEICSRRGRAAMIAGEEEEFSAPVAARQRAARAALAALRCTRWPQAAPVAATRALIVDGARPFRSGAGFRRPETGLDRPRRRRARDA